MTTLRRAAWTGLALLTVGCVRSGRTPNEVPAEPALGPDTVAVDTGRYATREPGALHTVTSEPVALGPTYTGRPFEVALRSAEARAGHARRFGTITLPITLRQSPALTQYPCSSCHAGTRLAMAAKRVPDAHQNIQPVHPKATGAVCSTCHARENVERLALLDGERPPLDHAYRLCAQCHFAQVQAWAHGGHGKRLDGWQGRRVVMGCSDCHNPHSPALEPRIPFRAPELEPRQRPEP
jgi:hypothetical protein